MKIVTYALVGAALLSATACKKAPVATPVAGNEASYDNSAATGPALSPAQQFANSAAASDAFEIATSQLALQKSSSSRVKGFADQMIKAHQDSTAKLKAAAASATPAITPDATLTAAQSDVLARLKAIEGPAFDAAYIGAQRDAHEATLAALRDYSAHGDIAPLKEFATKVTPIVAAHLNMAKGLKG